MLQSVPIMTQTKVRQFPWRKRCYRVEPQDESVDARALLQSMPYAPVTYLYFQMRLENDRVSRNFACEVGFLLLFNRITFAIQDFPSPAWVPGYLSPATQIRFVPQTSVARRGSYEVSIELALNSRIARNQGT